MELQQNKFIFDDSGVISFAVDEIKIKTSKKHTSPTAIPTYKYRILDNIYCRIYDSLNIDLLETREMIKIGDIIAYPDERQAEIDGTQLLDLDERIKVHNDYLENRKKELARPCGV